eukprot:scaffold778_cov263-Pinguiococcus_pyrenoidosus.AAC.3
MPRSPVDARRAGGRSGSCGCGAARVAQHTCAAAPARDVRVSAPHSRPDGRLGQQYHDGAGQDAGGRQRRRLPRSGSGGDQLQHSCADHGRDGEQHRQRPGLHQLPATLGNLRG